MEQLIDRTCDVEGCDAPGLVYESDSGHWICRYHYCLQGEKA